MNNRPAPSSPFQPPGFTFIELLVIVAVLGLLWVSLAPALCGSKNLSKVTACAANFRQWAASANMYAKDNRDLLPSLNWNGAGGAYLIDVSPNMCNALGPYQLTVPNWFCPVRPNELDGATAQLGRPIRTIQDLTQAFSASFYNELQLRDNYWVPRSQLGGATFPIEYSLSIIQPVFIKGTPAGRYGWPKQLDDQASAHVPFVSDLCASGSGNGFTSPPQGVGPSPANISPNTAHFFGGRLNGVNAAYVDGHVEMHNPAAIHCGYTSGSGATYWFY